jgi:Tfp pilus assembly protein PilF
VASYDRALALQPRAATIWNNRGVALEHMSRLNEALAAFDTALTADGNSTEALNNRGRVLAALGRQGEADASFARALTLTPDFRDAPPDALDSAFFEDTLASYDEEL